MWRHTTGTTGGNSLHPTQKWMGNITEWSGWCYVEATRKTQDKDYWRQFIASDPAMDGTWRWWCPLLWFFQVHHTTRTPHVLSATILLHSYPWIGLLEHAVLFRFTPNINILNILSISVFIYTEPAYCICSSNHISLTDSCYNNYKVYC